MVIPRAKWLIQNWRPLRCREDTIFSDWCSIPYYLYPYHTNNRDKIYLQLKYFRHRIASGLQLLCKEPKKSGFDVGKGEAGVTPVLKYTLATQTQVKQDEVRQKN